MRREEDGSTGFRHTRLQELIVGELRGLLRDDVSDPELYGVRITALVLSVDYRHARVHYALQASAATADERRAGVEHGLARATPFLRARLADALDIKRVPDLRFVFDAAAILPDDDEVD